MIPPSGDALAVASRRWRLAFAGLVTGAIGIACAPIFVRLSEIGPTARGWLVLLALGWISHAGGQTLIAFALAHLPAAFSSVSLLIQPVAAALFAWLLLREPLGAVQALGGAIVLADIVLARRGAVARPDPGVQR